MLNNIILVPVMDINFSFNTATTSNQLPSNANPIIEFSNSFSSAMMHTELLNNMNLVSALNFNRFLPNNLDGTQARTESSFSEQRDRSHLTLALNNFKARPLAQNDITSPSSLEGIPLICHKTKRLLSAQNQSISDTATPSAFSQQAQEFVEGFQRTLNKLHNEPNGLSLSPQTASPDAINLLLAVLTPVLSPSSNGSILSEVSRQTGSSNYLSPSEPEGSPKTTGISTAKIGNNGETMLTNTVSCVQSAVSMEHNGSSVSNAILPNSIRHFNTGLVELYQKQIQNTHPPFPGPEVAIQPIQSSTLYPSNNCTAEAIPSIKLRNQPISHVQQPRQRGKPLLSKIYEANLDEQDKKRLERKRARNRAAASKCRQKKLDMITDLEKKLNHEQERNMLFQQQIDQLQKETDRLNKLVQELKNKHGNNDA